MNRSPMPFLFVLLVLLAACSSTDRQRTEADRATFNWFAPVTRAYLEADATLDDAARRTHIRGLEAWDERIRAYEAQLAAPIVTPTAPTGEGR